MPEFKINPEIIYYILAVTAIIFGVIKFLKNTNDLTYIEDKYGINSDNIELKPSYDKKLLYLLSIHLLCTIIVYFASNSFDFSKTFDQIVYCVLYILFLPTMIWAVLKILRSSDISNKNKFINPVIIGAITVVIVLVVVLAYDFEMWKNSAIFLKFWLAIILGFIYLISVDILSFVIYVPKGIYNHNKYEILTSLEDTEDVYVKISNSDFGILCAKAMVIEDRSVIKNILTIIKGKGKGSNLEKDDKNQSINKIIVVEKNNYRYLDPQKYEITYNEFDYIGFLDRKDFEGDALESVFETYHMSE